MFEDENSYIEFLQTLRDKKIYPFPHKGSNGDTLIKFATSMLLEALGLEVVPAPRQADVILWPGGNISMWRANIKDLKTLIKASPDKQLVIGPAGFQPSVFTSQALIRDISKVCTAIFSREPDSYSYMQKCFSPYGVRVELSHDPSLCLRKSTWLQEQKRLSGEQYILACFRDDFESASFGNHIIRYMIQYLPFLPSLLLTKIISKITKERRLRKISSDCRSPAQVKKYNAAASDFDTYLSTIRNAKAVHTDRLHVMLLSAMLGKKTFAYRTAYNKLESVYSHSVSEFAEVELV